MMMNRLKNLKPYQTTAIFLAVVCVIAVFYVVYIPVNAGAGREVIVNEGDGLSVITIHLKEAGVIRSSSLFSIYSWALGQEKNLKAGRYVFSGYVNYPIILSKLSNGLAESDDVEVLIPEGSNIWDIDKKFVGAGLMKEGEFTRQLYANEGYLFPDTYRFPNPLKDKLSPNEYGQKIKDNFSFRTSKILSGLSSKSIKETIIVASILEKEAKTEEDMKIISGIIQRRLSLGLPLQIDATVSYGVCLGKALATGFKKDCDVTLIGVAEELKIDSPYNTYIRKGLSAGPISNPGLVAINAALNPTKSDYLYYLSTRDGGQIIYAKTSAEHLANRKKYLGF